MPTPEFSNTAMDEAAEQLLTIVKKGANLRYGNPGHLKLAMDVGDLLVFNAHGMMATFIPPGPAVSSHGDAGASRCGAAIIYQRSCVGQDQGRRSTNSATSIEGEGKNHHRCQAPASADRAAKESAGDDSNTTAVPAPSKSKRRPKPMPRRLKAAHAESKEKETGGTQGNSPPAYTSSQKGKGKEVGPAENDAVVNRGRTTRVEKRQKGSNTSSPPTAGGAGAMQHVADATTMQTKTSKCPKVVPELVSPQNDSPKLISPKEDRKSALDGAELIPPCDACMKSGIMCREGFGTTGATLKACGQCALAKTEVFPLPKLHLVNKARKDLSHAACPQTEVDADYSQCHRRITATATSVPPITTLDSQTPPPAEPSESSILDPPNAQQTMDVDFDDSGNGLTKVLEGMTLEAMQDSASLKAKSAALQDSTASLLATISELKAKNVTATTQLKDLQARIKSQDVALHELQGLWLEVAALQDEVKMLRGESTARDQQLWSAQDQLRKQERAMAVLQDAYNTIHQRLTGQPHSLSSLFTNSLYLTNPMYGASQPMVPLSMGQMQNMEGLYLNLLSSVANISNSSMLGAPAAGPSANAIAGSSCTGGDTISSMAPGSR
ncbi:hypothetical protein EDD22DRAFT_959906 [Suillus occidentalis]|nr:hypothetical protein EDD22DRAFT_959906 [Suillus occidentalis]